MSSIRPYLLFSLLLLLTACRPTHYPREVLWYDRAAENWNEALPIGNGHIAAMVYGAATEGLSPDGALTSRYDLNEETIFQGAPYNNNNPQCLAHLNEIRQLIFQNRSDSAQQLAERYITADSTQCQGTDYLPAGILRIRHDVPQRSLTDRLSGMRCLSDLSATPHCYRRTLDIDSALSTVTYRRQGIEYREESFCSFTRNVMVIRLTASQPGAINITPYIDQPPTDITLDKDINLKVLNNGGTQYTKGNTLYVRNADSVTILVAMATSFRNYRDISANPAAKTDSLLAAAGTMTYDDLKAEHVRYYQQQYRRMSLHLSTTNGNDRPTDLRIKHFHRTQDQSLVELLFQYGRYLLISSSQPGCQPANLQGKWSAEMKPAWGSRYTLNINTEMNYWMAETANLPELDEPLITMTRELAEQGRQTAREMYGCRGWVAHHNSDLWRMTGAIQHPRYGAWAMSGAWLCDNLWRHYAYSCDTTYLASVYDIMHDAALFYHDFLVRDPRNGYLVVCPSISPENGPQHLKKEVKRKEERGRRKEEGDKRKDQGGKRKKKVKKEFVSLLAGVTMDNELLYSLFTHVHAATRILHRDQAFGDTCLTLRRQLRPITIGKRGQIQEWAEDWDSPRDKHRHVSHLWALYPGDLINDSTPDLMRAARTTLRWRGDYSTGWSMAWKACLWARLHDGNHAYRIIENFITLIDPHNNEARGNGGLYPNMLCAHPPFQIDGNLGFTAAVLEMLAPVPTAGDDAHHPLHVRCALPTAWSHGTLTGLRRPGNVTIKRLQWHDGKVLFFK